MSDTVYVVVCVLGSIGSSVGLILVNKLLMNTFHFNYVLILTAMHLLVNAIEVEVMAVLGMFVRKWMPLAETGVMTVYCFGSIALMNRSLETNSLWSYQITKILALPMMVLLLACAGRGFSRGITTTLALVVVGVVIATVTDLDVNLFGIVFAVIAVYFSSHFQLLQGNKQREHIMDGVQINYALALPSFILCSLLALATELTAQNQSTSIRFHKFADIEIALILLSCVLAFGVNVFTYGLIGTVSPVAYQVIGYAKTCAVLICGFIYFPSEKLTGDTLAFRISLFGVVLQFVGVIIYLRQIGIATSENGGNSNSRVNLIESQAAESDETEVERQRLMSETASA